MRGEGRLEVGVGGGGVGRQSGWKMDKKERSWTCLPSPVAEHCPP